MNRERAELELRVLLKAMTSADVSKLRLDDDLIHELGFDSLAALRILAAVEMHFHVRFPDDRLAEFRSLRQVLEFVNLMTLTERNAGEPS